MLTHYFNLKKTMDIFNDIREKVEKLLEIAEFIAKYENEYLHCITNSTDMEKADAIRKKLNSDYYPKYYELKEILGIK